MSKFTKGIITISVDDGRKDAFRLAEELLPKYNIPATFNIVTGYVDLSNSGEKSSITLEQLKIMHQNPLVEIAGHGHTHKNDDEDILKGRNLLYEWLGITDDTIGFASPGSKMKNDFIKENGEHLRKLGFLYIRSGISIDKPTEQHEIVRERAKEYAVSDYVVNNVNQLTYGFDNMCVNSVIVFGHTTIEELKQLVDIAAEEKACLTFMFHSVAKKGEYEPDDLWSFDYDKFLQFAEYLAEQRNQEKIEVLTTRDAFLKGYKK